MNNTATTTTPPIRLTQYSHGAGCGCKIAPQVLDKILHSNMILPADINLLVGNSSRDDAAVYDLGNGQALISTTDFFMPIVDDPFQFGCIASANAISDVYAMGGKPVLAIAILGWPVDKLSPEIAQQVLEGSRYICSEAGISLAGGHSIDSPEPIFGLAVNGLVSHANLKQNNTAQEGDLIFLTKKIGVGILTTAEKKGILLPEHAGLAANQMMQLNSFGQTLGTLPSVTAMTDVTGFGLLGHLREMCDGSNLSATISFESIPLIIDELEDYIHQKAVPGGTQRNLASYGSNIHFAQGLNQHITSTILADPQTSGGLLVSINANKASQIIELLNAQNMPTEPIGYFEKRRNETICVIV